MPTTDTTGGWTRITITFGSYTTGTSNDTMHGGNWPSRHDRGEYYVESPLVTKAFRRLSKLARDIARTTEDFRKAIAEAALRAIPRALRVEERRRALGPCPSQLELAPRARARRHARQSVPARTRRRLRTWER